MYHDKNATLYKLIDPSERYVPEITHYEKRQDIDRNEITYLKKLWNKSNRTVSNDSSKKG